MSRVTHDLPKGFTLLEIILVIILAMAIAVVLGLIASQGIRGGLAQAERRDMVKEGMVALEKMTRDMRMMGDSAGAVGGLNDCGPGGAAEGNEPDGDVEYASDTIFNFRHNGLSSAVCYFLESGTLWRAQGCAGACSIAACAEQAVARNVVNSDPFDYYRYNGTKLPNGVLGPPVAGTLCQIWRIQIELQLRRGTSTTDPMRNVTLRTSVFPRDLAER